MSIIICNFVVSADLTYDRKKKHIAKSTEI